MFKSSLQNRKAWI